MVVKWQKRRRILQDKHYQEIKDLELIGYKFPDEYVESIKKQEKAKAEKSRKKREEKQVIDYIDCDETFAYIAGYTSGGAPFGITWEEMEKFEELEKEG